MSRENIMAKQLRGLVPYLEMHDPMRYRRFAPAAAAAPLPKEVELTDEERQEMQERERRLRLRRSDT